MSSLFMGEGNEKQRTSLQGAGLSLLSALPAIGSFIGQSIKLTIKGVDIGCTIVKGAKLIGYGGSAIVAGYGAANGAMDMYRKYAINGEKAGWHTFGEVGSVTLQTVGAFSSGSQALAAAGGRWCFTGETLVATREGLKPIEEIREGDYVLSEDAETGEQSYQQVLQTYINESDTLIHVVTGEDEIETTPMHPFYVIGRGFVPAGELAVGDKLKDSEGRETEVVDVWTEVLDEPVLVYNLEVEESHTYYVGAGMVLVHNDCTLPINKSETLELPGPGETSSRRAAAEQKLADAASGISVSPTIDPVTKSPVGTIYVDPSGNAMISPVGGTLSLKPSGHKGLDMETIYPNGSSYYRNNPNGHIDSPGKNHGHGHLMGSGPGKKGTGPSLDLYGNIVDFWSSAAHWPTKK